MGEQTSTSLARVRIGVSAMLGMMVATSAFAGATAQAAPTDGPNWHISAFGYDKLHAQGFTGKGVTIAIAEAGIDLNASDLQGADIEYVPLPEQCVDPQLPKKFINHGTMMAETIVGQGHDGGVQGIAAEPMQGTAGRWAFEALRIAAGVPRIFVDTDERTIPNEIGLYGTHLDKGCYPGRETGAKVHTLGRPPRRLVQLHLDAQLDADGIEAAQEMLVDPDVGLRVRPRLR